MGLSTRDMFSSWVPLLFLCQAVSYSKECDFQLKDSMFCSKSCITGQCLFSFNYVLMFVPFFSGHRHHTRPKRRRQRGLSELMLLHFGNGVGLYSYTSQQFSFLLVSFCVNPKIHVNLSLRNTKRPNSRGVSQFL